MFDVRKLIIELVMLCLYHLRYLHKKIFSFRQMASRNSKFQFNVGSNLNVIFLISYNAIPQSSVCPLYYSDWHSSVYLWCIKMARKCIFITMIVDGDGSVFSAVANIYLILNKIPRELRNISCRNLLWQDKLFKLFYSYMYRALTTL